MMSKRRQLQYIVEFLLKLKECEIFFPSITNFHTSLITRSCYKHEPVVFSYDENQPLIALAFIWNIIFTHIYGL